MKNIWKFTETVIRIDEFLKNTGNKYRLVNQKPYLDNSGKAGNVGTTLTLMILEDSTDYGIDQNTGNPRENNVYENFEVTILDGVTYHADLKKGDLVSLSGFIPELSFAIGFDWILRFKNIQKGMMENDKTKK